MRHKANNMGFFNPVLWSADPVMQPLSVHQDMTPEGIGALAANIQVKVSASARSINDINLQAKLLSINAQIEAAHAGSSGRAFGVVAAEMAGLSRRTEQSAHELVNSIQPDIENLLDMSQQLSVYMQDVRGQRLSDLALNNIDLIDRNLYERSCDVRWWATDPSLTQACQAPDVSAVTQHAAQRMGIILDAYTVYFDLVLCTPNGDIIANGRPNTYASVGKNVADAPWFQDALQTASGDEFAFQSAHVSALVDDQRTLVYACAVRQQGERWGAVIGVLGLLFRFDALAQTVVTGTALPEHEKAKTRVMVVDASGLILADTAHGALQERLSFPDLPALFALKKGFLTIDKDGQHYLAAHADSPGFETYATGWHSVILQAL